MMVLTDVFAYCVCMVVIVRWVLERGYSDGEAREGYHDSCFYF